MAGQYWTHDELLLAFNLYCKLPFGLFNKHNPEVIKLSKLIDRTPSAVAMKLSNFAFLDPQQNGKGLSNYSSADKAAWLEFTSDWEKTLEDVESLMLKLAPQAPMAEIDKAQQSIQVEKDFEYQSVERSQTEIERVIKARVGQRIFRKMILANYGLRCCICKLPIQSMLVASHIIPWKDRWDLRLNPYNGLCMCSLHDKAFDTGLLTVSEDYQVVVSSRVSAYLPDESIEIGISRYEGKTISLPDKFIPERAFLRKHYDHYFIKA